MVRHSTSSPRRCSAPSWWSSRSACVRHNTARYMVWCLGGAARSQELDLVILVGLFQLRLFHAKISRKNIRCIDFWRVNTQKWQRKAQCKGKNRILNNWRIYSWQLWNGNDLFGFSIYKDRWGKLRMTQSLLAVGCLIKEPSFYWHCSVFLIHARSKMG